MRTESAPSPSCSRDKGTDEQGPRIRRWQGGGTGSEIIGFGITTGSKASKQTIFLTRGRRGRRRGRGARESKGNRGRADVVVEGDRKGRVVVIGSKEDTYWTLSGVFITPFSRARFKCFWLCLRTRVHPPSPPFRPSRRCFSLPPLALYTLNRLRFLPPLPPHSFPFTARFLRARPPCTLLRKPRKVHGTKGCNYHLGSSWPLPGKKGFE